MSAAAQRLTQLAIGTSGKAKVLAKHDDDVVIVSALRTAITKVRCVLKAFLPELC